VSGAEIKAEPGAPLVAGAPVVCAGCGAPLCLRKQVINLAVGNVEHMWCLVCLAADGGQAPTQVLSGLKTYIEGRQCFFKEWSRYESVEFCPDRQGCFPAVCFELERS
jgi:hypothetical protein